MAREHRRICIARALAPSRIAALLVASVGASGGMDRALAAESAASATSEAQGQPRSAAAGTQVFSILEYQIEGNTLLPVIEVERAVTPFLGESRGIKDVEAARAQLEKIYHDRGYKTVLVNIPPQRVNEGVVRLAVTEAPVGKLKIEGSRFHSLEQIREKFAQLNPEVVPNFDVVQKELGDVNRTADLRVTPVLKASETPGKVDVDLNVQDSLAAHAILEVNNHYSANTTALRASAELRYDNLFQTNQSASFQYQIAPERPSDAKIWSASYVIPMTSHMVWALYAVHSDSDVAAVGGLDVIGNGDIFGVRAIFPLPTERASFYHSFTAGIDYKKFGQDVLLSGSTDAVESPVSYAPFTIQYSATWFGSPAATGSGAASTSTGRSSTSLYLGINFLLGGLGADWKEFANKRAGAAPSYITIHPSLSREQVLPWRWSLVGTLEGQLANGPLINNEQYVAGGADSVRGYVEAERLADEGIRSSLELRTPPLFAWLAHRPEQSYLFLFVDGARLTMLEPLPGQIDRFTLLSAGLGLRLKIAGLTLHADGAYILRAGAVTPEDSYRGVFSLSYAY
jgi:hemolysin activation/secretion protein